MPNIGEVRKASEIGYRGHAFYLYSFCDTCGKERWVREQDISSGRGLVCRSCGYPSSNRFKGKLEQLRKVGAKRASELSKPRPKSRDPWYYPHACHVCGKAVWHQKKDLHRVCKQCAYIVRQTARGDQHANWKGGRYYHGDGYILVQIPPTNPYYLMAHERGYILEHRLIKAQQLGRCLLDSEIIHHINGNRQDNRPENLELLPNNASHLPYITLQHEVAILKEKAVDQEKEIRLLKWHIRELEHGNPELAGSKGSRASVETLQEAHPSDGEEKVRP